MDHDAQTVFYKNVNLTDPVQIAGTTPKGAHRSCATTRLPSLMHSGVLSRETQGTQQRAYLASILLALLRLPAGTRHGKIDADAVWATVAEARPCQPRDLPLPAIARPGRCCRLPIVLCAPLRV